MQDMEMETYQKLKITLPISTYYNNELLIGLRLCKCVVSVMLN